MDDQVQKIIHNGVEWAVHEYSMSEDEVLEILTEHGKVPCSCCARIKNAEDVDEDGICGNCVCRDCE